MSTLLKTQKKSFLFIVFWRCYIGTPVGTPTLQWQQIQTKKRKVKKSWKYFLTNQKISIVSTNSFYSIVIYTIINSTPQQKANLNYCNQLPVPAIFIVHSPKTPTLLSMAKDSHKGAKSPLLREAAEVIIW